MGPSRHSKEETNLRQAMRNHIQIRIWAMTNLKRQHHNHMMSCGSTTITQHAELCLVCAVFVFIDALKFEFYAISLMMSLCHTDIACSHIICIAFSIYLVVSVFIHRILLEFLLERSIIGLDYHCDPLSLSIRIHFEHIA